MENDKPLSILELAKQQGYDPIPKQSIQELAGENPYASDQSIQELAGTNPYATGGSIQDLYKAETLKQQQLSEQTAQQQNKLKQDSSRNNDALIKDTSTFLGGAANAALAGIVTTNRILDVAASMLPRFVAVASDVAVTDDAEAIYLLKRSHTEVDQARSAVYKSIISGDIDKDAGYAQLTELNDMKATLPAFTAEMEGTLQEGGRFFDFLGTNEQLLDQQYRFNKLADGASNFLSSKVAGSVNTGPDDALGEDLSAVFDTTKTDFSNAWKSLSEGDTLKGSYESIEALASTIGDVVYAGAANKQAVVQGIIANLPMVASGAISSGLMAAITGSLAVNEIAVGIKDVQDRTGKLVTPEQLSKIILSGMAYAGAEYAGNAFTLGSIKALNVNKQLKSILSGETAASKAASKATAEAAAKEVVVETAEEVAEVTAGEIIKGAAKAAGGVAKNVAVGVGGKVGRVAGAGASEVVAEGTQTWAEQFGTKLKPVDEQGARDIFVGGAVGGLIGAGTGPSVAAGLTVGALAPTAGKASVEAAKFTIKVVEAAAKAPANILNYVKTNRAKSAEAVRVREADAVVLKNAIETGDYTEYTNVSRPDFDAKTSINNLVQIVVAPGTEADQEKKESAIVGIAQVQRAYAEQIIAANEKVAKGEALTEEEEASLIVAKENATYASAMVEATLANYTAQVHAPITQEEITKVAATEEVTAEDKATTEKLLGSGPLAHFQLSLADATKIRDKHLGSATGNPLLSPENEKILNDRIFLLETLEKAMPGKKTSRDVGREVLQGGNGNVGLYQYHTNIGNMLKTGSAISKKIAAPMVEGFRTFLGHQIAKRDMLSDAVNQLESGKAVSGALAAGLAKMGITKLDNPVALANLLSVVSQEVEIGTVIQEELETYSKKTGADLDLSPIALDTKVAEVAAKRAAEKAAEAPVDFTQKNEEFDKRILTLPIGKAKNELRSLRETIKSAKKPGSKVPSATLDNMLVQESKLVARLKELRAAEAVEDAAAAKQNFKEQRADRVSNAGKRTSPSTKTEYTIVDDLDGPVKINSKGEISVRSIFDRDTFKQFIAGMFAVEEGERSFADMMKIFGGTQAAFQRKFVGDYLGAMDFLFEYIKAEEALSNAGLSGETLTLEASRIALSLVAPELIVKESERKVVTPTTKTKKSGLLADINLVEVSDDSTVVPMEERIEDYNLSEEITSKVGLEQRGSDSIGLWLTTVNQVKAFFSAKRNSGAAKFYKSKKIADLKGVSALTAVKDFFATISKYPETVAHILGKPLTEKQQLNMEMLTQFNADMTKQANRYFTNGNRMSDFAQFLINKTTGKLDSNVMGAVSVAIYNEIATKLSGTIWNDDVTIRKILKMKDSAPADMDAFAELREAGIPKTVIVGELGKNIVKALGISFTDKESAPHTTQDKLEKALGAWAFAFMSTSGYLVPVTVNQATLSAASKTALTGKESKITFYRVATKLDPETGKEVPSNRVQVIVDANKETESILGTLFKVKTLVVPTFTPVEEVATKSSDGSRNTSKVEREGLLKDQTTGWTLIRSMHTAFSDLLNLSDQEKLAGVKDPSAFMKAERDSVENKNRGLRKELSDYRDHVEGIKNWNDGLGLGSVFYFMRTVWPQGRMGMDSQTVNPVRSKVHRFLMGTADAIQSVSYKNTDAFFTTLAEITKQDKVDKANPIAAVKAYLWGDNKTTLDAAVEALNWFDTYSAEDAKDKALGVIKGTFDTIIADSSTTVGKETEAFTSENADVTTLMDLLGIAAPEGSYNKTPTEASIAVSQKEVFSIYESIVSGDLTIEQAKPLLAKALVWVRTADENADNTERKARANKGATKYGDGNPEAHLVLQLVEELGELATESTTEPVNSKTLEIQKRALKVIRFGADTVVKQEGEHKGKTNYAALEDTLGSKDEARAKVMAGIEVMGGKVHGLNALVNYAAYMNGLENNQDSFESSLLAEVDGVANGPTLAMFLFNSYTSLKQAIAAGTRGGIIMGRGDAIPYNEQRIAPDHLDHYEFLSLAWLRQIQIQDKKAIKRKFDISGSIATRLLVGDLGSTRLVVNNLGSVKSFDVELGVDGRDMGKGPLMQTMYGSSVGAIMKGLTASAIKRTHERLAAAFLSEDAAEVEFIVHQFYEATGLVMEINYTDLKANLEEILITPAMEEQLGGAIYGAYGKPLGKALETEYGTFLETRTTAVKLGNVMAKMYNIAYTKLHADMVKKLAEEGVIAVNKKGEPLDNLPTKYIEKLRAAVKVYQPGMHSYFSEREGDKEAGIFFGGLTTKDSPLGRQNVVTAEDAPSLAAKGTQTSTRSVAAGINIKQLADPGVSFGPMAVQMIDATIMRLALSKLRALGIHDAIITNSEILNEAAKALNEATAEVLSQTNLFEMMHASYSGASTAFDKLLDSLPSVEAADMKSTLDTQIKEDEHLQNKPNAFGVLDDSPVTLDTINQKAEQTLARTKVVHAAQVAAMQEVNQYYSEAGAFIVMKEFDLDADAADKAAHELAIDALRHARSVNEHIFDPTMELTAEEVDLAMAEYLMDVPSANLELANIVGDSLRNGDTIETVISNLTNDRATADKFSDETVMDLVNKLELGSSTVGVDKTAFTDPAVTVNSLNILDIFNKMADKGNVKDSAAHTQHLTRIISDVVSRVLTPINLRFRNDSDNETAGQYHLKTDGTIDILIAAQTNPPRPGSSAKVNGIQMSAQEVLVHEHIHAIIGTLLDSHSDARRDIKRLWTIAKRKLSVEDFLADLGLPKNDPTYSTEYDAAQARYDHIFNNATGESLHEFAALGLSNERFKTLLASEKVNTKETLKSMGNMSLVDKLLQVWKVAMDFVVKKFNKAYNNTADVQLESLVKELVGIELREKAPMLATLDTVNKAVSYPVSLAINSMNKGLVKVANSKAASNSKNNFVKLGSNLIKLGNTVVPTSFYEQLRKRQSALSNAEYGFAQELWTEMRGRTPTNGWAHNLLMLKNKFVDQASLHASESVLRTVNKAFLHPLSDALKVAITKVLLKTDASSLLTHYSVQQLMDFVDPNSGAAAAEIDKIHAELNATYIKDPVKGVQEGDLTHFLQRSARALAAYMVTGKVIEHHLSKNAHNIVMEAEDITGAAIGSFTNREALITKLDHLASLQAIEMTATANRGLMYGLMVAEGARGIDSGVLTTISVHNDIKKLAAENTFEGDRVNIAKGYLKPILNDQISVIYAPLSEKAGLEARNFVMQDRKVNSDQLDIMAGGEDVYMFISKDASLATYNSGVLSNTAMHRAGHDIAKIMRQTNPNVTTAEIDARIATIAKNKRHAIKEMFNSRLPPLSPSTNILIPILSPNGGAIDYHYEMDERAKDDIYQQRLGFDELLGITASNTVNKIGSRHINKEGIQALYDNYTKEAKDHSNVYVWIGPNSMKAEHREQYQMLPTQTRENIKEVWGTNGMFVRKDLVPLFLGNRKVSVQEWMDMTQADVDRVHNAALRFAKQAMFDIKESMSPGVKHAVSVSGRVLGELTKEAKDFIVVKIGVVTAANFISNAFLLRMHGVSTSDIIRLQYEAGKALPAYQRAHQESNDSKLELSKMRAFSVIKNPRDERILIARIAELEKEMMASPIHDLMEAGAMQSLVEDLDQGEDKFSYKSQLGDKLEELTKNVPELAKTVAKNIYMSRDTAFYKVMNNAVLMSDFVARYALHQHQMKRAKNPLSREESIGKVVHVFINYDLPTNRWIQFFNDTGFVWFSKYALRVQMVMLETFRDHPVEAISTLITASLVDAPNVTESFALTKNWDRTFSNIVEVGLSGASNAPAVAVAKAALGT